MAAQSVGKKIYYEEVKGEPEPRVVQVGEINQKVSSVRDTVLQTIRTHMPIDTLFKPELKIHLETFISDQILFRAIAEFLITLPEENVDAATIAEHINESPLSQRLKELFNPTLLPLFYEACADVLNRRSLGDRMRAALGGRIFTLKNALIAQQNPDALRKNQMDKGLEGQSKKEIQEEGAAFLRQCLAMHLEMVRGKENGSFKSELTKVAEELIPFVRLVTRSYLQENIIWIGHCPDDPLTFRNPTGYNRHGLVAATVMEAALQALGYQTRLMGRCDLDPRATLATAHNIVEVTGPDGVKYIIDPAYLQFHKDVCISNEGLCKDQVLVLEERDVPDYVERTLMHHWQQTFRRVRDGDQVTLKKLEENDQLFVYVLDRIEGLPPVVKPPNMERWARSSLTRPWDLKSHYPISSDVGYQEIFNGAGKTQRTYDLVQPLGISKLTRQQTYEELTKRLDVLMKTERGKNSQEALSLFAQLPRSMRQKYSPLLEVDPRATELDPCINAYFRSLAKVVNPRQENFRVVYGCSGADATSVLESTNASDLYFVDLTKGTFADFHKALKHLQSLSPKFLESEKQGFERQSNFMSFKLRYSGAQSNFRDGQQYMSDLPAKLFLDLRSIGVDLTQIKLTPLKSGAVRMDFPWQYHGSAETKMRSLTFMTADITSPDTYPPELQEALSSGIDAFFMKGAFFAPRQYPQFLPVIAKALKDSGWLMTTDKTWSMETVNPEDCLGSLTFDRVRAEEPTRLSEVLHPPFDPFLEIGLMKMDRIARNPGTDISYWTLLNLRRKK